jgi:hypothetical protein
MIFKIKNHAYYNDDTSRLSLRNKERVQLELQLKSKAKELGRLENSLDSQTAEVDDLVFALEASNTENK